MQQPPQIRIDTGLVKPSNPLERYCVVAQKHNEKGRDPINNWELILDKVAKATNTKIPRWCRYSEQELNRAYIRFGEALHVRNKAAYFIWLIKNP